VFQGGIKRPPHQRDHSPKDEFADCFLIQDKPFRLLPAIFWLSGTFNPPLVNDSYNLII
jgi:hypothetical protein